MTLRIALASALLALAIVGCGSSSNPSAPLKDATCGHNAPVLSLTGGSSVNANAPLQLTVSASDADNATSCGVATTVTDIRWSVVSAPHGGSAELGSSSTLPQAGGSCAAGAFCSENTVRADHGGTYVVQAIATASNGTESAPAQLTVTVGDCGSGVPVVQGVTVSDANGATSRPAVGDAVTVAAFPVIDPDHDAAGACGSSPLPAATYAWSVVSAPAGYAQASAIASSTSSSVSFVPNVAGTYQLSVVAVSSTGVRSQPYLVTVPTGDCGPTVGGGLNAAIGAAPASPDPGTSVTLSMGAVSDACIAGATVTQSWTFASRPTGSQAVLLNASSQSPSFVPDVPGVYGVELVVTDNAGESSVYSTTVTAGACTPPSILPLSTSSLYTVTNTGGSGVIYAGNTVTLSLPTAGVNSGGALAGTCGGIASYQWSMISRPAGSTATLSATDQATPSFVPDVPGGSYQFAVVVRDALGNASSPFLFTLQVDPCGGYPPVTNQFALTQKVPTASGSGYVTDLVSTGATSLSGGTTTSSVGFYLGQPMEISSSVSDADTSGACTAAGVGTQTVSYVWSLLGAPVGSHAAVAGTSSAYASFTPDVAGDYTLRLQTTDSTGASSSSAVTFTVSCGANAPVIASLTEQQAATGSASGSPAIVGLGSAVSLGTVVSDADTSPAGACNIAESQTLTYQWAFTQLPAGSGATLIGADTATPSFIPDVVTNGTGTDVPYIVELTVTDPNGHTASSRISLSALTTQSASGPVFTSTAIDPTTGNPVVATWDPTSRTLTAARCTSDCSGTHPVWESMGTVDASLGTLSFSAEDELRPVAVKVSSTGTVYVAYHTGAGPASSAATTSRSNPYCSAVLAKWTSGTSWTTTGFATQSAGCNADLSGGNTVAGRYLSMDIDSTGPVIGWTEEAPSVAVPVVALCNSSPSCSSLLPTSGSGQLGKFVSVAVNGSTVAAAFYSENDGAQGASGIYYAECPNCRTSQAFTTTEVMHSSVDLGRFTRLAIVQPTATNGLASPEAMIAFRDTTDRVAAFTDCSTASGCTNAGSWTGAHLLDNSGDVGDGMATAVDGNGMLQVSYRRSDGYLLLKQLNPSTRAITALQESPLGLTSPLGDSMDFSTVLDQAFVVVSSQKGALILGAP